MEEWVFAGYSHSAVCGGAVQKSMHHQSNLKHRSAPFISLRNLLPPLQHMVLGHTLQCGLPPVVLVFKCKINLFMMERMV